MATAAQKRNLRVWVKALRSGEYEQGVGKLCRTIRGKEKWCCLGVAADVLGEGWWIHTAIVDEEYWYYETETGSFRMSGYLPTEVMELLGMADDQMNRLVKVNDVEKKSFNEIADWIEREFSL